MTTRPRLTSIGTRTYDARWPLADVRMTSRVDGTRSYEMGTRNKIADRGLSGAAFTGFLGEYQWVQRSKSALQISANGRDYGRGFGGSRREGGSKHPDNL